ncbi:MAG: M56 family metallopeptidase [Bryobacteraceae bacterium]
MNALELWIHSDGAKALGWTLFHFLWEGAAIAGLLVLALAFLKHASARARYAAACAALLGMALAFGITLAVEWPWDAGRLTIATDPLAGGTMAGALFANGAGGTGFRWSEGLAWAPALWLAGVLGLYLYRLGSWMAAQRLRRMGTCAAPEPWQRRLRELAGRMGVARPVALLESCLADVPIMIGYLKPAIVTPIGLLAGLPAEQVEAVLLHELAHIRRADYLINLMQTGIEGLLFYHPAVWWVSGVVRAERENCCDDAVVALQGNAREYAAALFTVEQRRSRVPQAALAATGGSLARRIRRLLGKPDARDLSLPVLPSVLLLVSMAVALAAWQPAQPQSPAAPVAAEPVRAATEPIEPQEPAAPQPAASAQEPAKPQPAAQVRDVAGAHDVTYIITDEERAAFLKLRSDDDRQKFIQQFWLRRISTTGAATNQSGDGYSRRLAYADAHFALATGDRTMAGSQTSMGRTYIRYGPPDQIEDHSSDPQNPSQNWRYNYLEDFHSSVEFQFVRAGNGYRERINWPPPMATFEGVGGGAGGLALALSRESQLRGGAVAESVKPGLPGRHASMRIYPVRDYRRLSIPLDSLSGRVDILGEIRTLSNTGAEGSAVANVRDSADASTGGDWEANFTLEPGSYVCRVLVREQATGQMYGETINFEVK